MNRNKKITLLIILIAGVVYIWAPKPNKPAATSADTFDDLMPIAVNSNTASKSTSFDKWGRDPFTWPQVVKDTNDICGLTLFAITFQGERSEAMIDDKIVYIGDTIADKTVKAIEIDRVILTDGKKDYTLKMK